MIKYILPLGIVMLLPSFAALATTPGADDLNLDPSYWLKKMDGALQTASYQGRFFYMRGSQLETVEVAHKIVDGIEYERMTSLNGEKREIIRKQDELVCYHDVNAINPTSAPKPNSKHSKIDAHHAVPMGPFTHAFTENLNYNQAYYRVDVRGRGRVAGRDAIQMRVSPKNNDRYGYVLWLDEASGLLLQSNLVNRGKVLELFQFTQVEIGDDVTGIVLTASVAENAPNHTLSHGGEHDQAADDAEAKAQLASRKPNIKVPWVPNGFVQVGSVANGNYQFSDGVSNLSIFVEKADANGLGEMQTSMGGTVVISRKVKGTTYQVTLVGEVPLSTARKVAESIEPIIY